MKGKIQVIDLYDMNQLENDLNRIEATGRSVLSVFLSKKSIKVVTRKPRERSPRKAGSYDKSLEAIYQAHYPRKRGKAEGLQILRKIIKSEKDLEDFKAAVINFESEMKREGRAEDKIPYFSTFVSKYWQDFKPGTFKKKDRYEFL